MTADIKVTADIESEVPEPLRDCFLHSEVVCVRECCGIDAISQEPELIAAWGRKVGHQKVMQALAQLETLIAQVEDRSPNVTSSFLNACTKGEIGQGELLSFLHEFQIALRSCPVNEVLTRAEMETQFPGEWVLIADPELDKNLEVVRGLVVSHSSDQEIVDTYEINPKIIHWASLYFGPPTNKHIWLNNFL